MPESSDPDQPSPPSSIATASAPVVTTPTAAVRTRRVFTSAGPCALVTGKAWGEIVSLANIEVGPSLIVRVENGGRGIAEIALAASPPVHSVVLLCGTGLKASYALRAGAHLVNRGIAVVAFLPLTDSPPASLELHLRLFSAAGGRVVRSLKDLPTSFELAIDALHDTDSTAPMPVEAIRWLNACRSAIYSIDWPSGSDADTATARGEAVVPTATIGMGALRAGCATVSAPAVTGTLHLVDLGLPASAFERVGGHERYVSPFGRSFTATCAYN